MRLFYSRTRFTLRIELFFGPKFFECVATQAASKR